MQRMDDTSSSAAARHEAYAKAALTAYGLPGTARARMISLSENATFLVETDHPVGVLRVYRIGYQSEAAIRSELAWIEALLVLPRKPMLRTREIARADLVAALQPERIQLEYFLDAWLEPDTQAGLRAMLARIGK